MGLLDFFRKAQKDAVNTQLNSLPDPFVDEYGRKWNAIYKYDDIEVQLANSKCRDVKVNQEVEFHIVSENMKEITAIDVICEGINLGHLVKSGQRHMIRDYTIRKEALVKAQVSGKSKNSVLLQVYYYKSKDYLDRCSEEYEREKATYVHKPTEFIEVVLISNKNERMQHDISFCQEGELIELSEHDNDKILISTITGLDIGYLPKRIVNKIRELEDREYAVEYKGKIIEIIVNDNGTKDVKIQLLLEDITFL